MRKVVEKTGSLAFMLVLGLLLSGIVRAEVPGATVTGPVASEEPGHPSRNFPFSASAIELQDNGYIEEEYFIAGTANRYLSQEMQNGEVVDSGHRYRTRLIVRRPANASDFNGVVVVEWINVTGGTDKDIDWWQSGSHFVRNGYAFVAVSAQQVGIDTMKQWNPTRYASLDTTHDGMVENDDLSYDIFSAVGRAIPRQGEGYNEGDAQFMGALRARMILATGHSQSASRLANYLNSIHPLDPVYDGMMVHGGGGHIRDDQPVKIFKIMAEGDMRFRAAQRQPDSDNFRQWEVAGTSHVDIPFEVEWSKVRLLSEGQALDQAAPRDPGCELPAHSRVPFRDAMNAAFEHLVVWVDNDTPPPVAPPLKVRRIIPSVEFDRDEFGNALGGIQLAEHAVATALNAGTNTGNNRFCVLYGHHAPFSESQLRALYPDHDSYVRRVEEVVNANLESGFILPYAAERTLREARMSDIGNWD